MEDMHELTAEQQAELLRHELEAVYGSSSYKIGRAVTWLPRHAARGGQYNVTQPPRTPAKKKKNPQKKQPKHFFYKKI